MLFISSTCQPWQGLEDLFLAASRYEGNFVCHIIEKLTVAQSDMPKKDSRFRTRFTAQGRHKQSNQIF